MLCNNEVGLELSVNTKETKYTLLSCHQNAEKNHGIKIANRSSENVAQFRYLGMTVTNQNLVQDEIQRRLISGNACNHSVQNLLYFHLLLKKVNISINKTMILPVVLYGYETGFLTLWEEHRLRLFKKRVLKGISEISRDEVT
jgi:hypothetical protein